MHFVDLLKTVLNYTEVWALIVPILVWIIKKPSLPILFPVKVYLCISFVLNIVIDLANFKIYKNNNALYNTESMFRLSIFIWFFFVNGIPLRRQNLLYLLSLIALAILVNF